jgi:hypothetical protein
MYNLKLSFWPALSAFIIGHGYEILQYRISESLLTSQKASDEVEDSTPLEPIGSGAVSHPPNQQTIRTQSGSLTAVECAGAQAELLWQAF